MAAVTVKALVDVVAADRVVGRCIDDARERRPVLDVTAPAALRPLLAAVFAEHAKRTVLLVTSTYREAEQLTAEVSSVLGSDAVAYYPAWETLPHERLSPRSDTVGRRLAVLRRLVGTDEAPRPKVVVAPVRSLLQPQVKGLGDMRPVLSLIHI